jgi:four helix bundle protein
MGTISSHRDLIAWQKAFELSARVYAVTESFPSSERFGLTAQLRRASVSIVSNIAEEYGRGSTADYIRFLRSSRGSVYEVDTQLLLAVRLGYMSQEVHQALQVQLDEAAKVLAGLIRSVDQQP